MDEIFTHTPPPCATANLKPRPEVEVAVFSDLCVYDPKSGRRPLPMIRFFGAAAVAALVLSGSLAAQNRRIASPPGTAATEIGGHYDVREGYVGGHWLELRFGRPIKRGRDLFG